MKNKQHNEKKYNLGGWLFLIIVILIYGISALLNDELALDAMQSFIQLFYKVLPVLLIVFMLILLVNLLLKPSWVKKYLGHRSGITGWFAAIVGGVLATGPIYPWYALLKELRDKGMKTALVAVFLYSRAVKLPLLPLLVHYFGITYTLVLVCYLILFSILNGFVMEQIKGLYTDVN